MDDYTLIYPKFATSYQYEFTTGTSTLSTEGRFEDALLQLDMIRFNGNKYNAMADRYASYLYGNQGLAHIKNLQNEDGLKILIIKDSFMLPVFAFLSTVCSDLYLIDPRYYENNIIDYANSLEDLDYIMVSFTPQNLTEEFFNFGK